MQKHQQKAPKYKNKTKKQKTWHETDCKMSTCPYVIPQSYRHAKEFQISKMKSRGLEFTCVSGSWNAFKLNNEQYSMESKKKNLFIVRELKQEGRTLRCSTLVGNRQTGRLKFYAALLESVNDHQQINVSK